MTHAMKQNAKNSSCEIRNTTEIKLRDMFILKLSASKIALIQNDFDVTVLPFTQAKENLTFT